MSATPYKKEIKCERKSLTPNRGQLTGIPRKIRDGVADIYNCIQKWETLKNKGFNIATNIANLKIEKRRNDERSCYPDGLDALCHDFKVVVDDMQQLQTKMCAVNDQFEKIARMSSVSSSEVFFISWRPRRFANSSNILIRMYQQEMKAKLTIVESIAHVDFIQGYFSGLRSPESARNILMTYVASWLHEPCINEDVRDVTLEEMLLETGHHQ